MKIDHKLNEKLPPLAWIAIVQTNGVVEVMSGDAVIHKPDFLLQGFGMENAKMATSTLVIFHAVLAQNAMTIMWFFPHHIIHKHVYFRWNLEGQFCFLIQRLFY